jgi:ferrochelatase
MKSRHLVLVTYGEPPAPDFFAQLRYSWRILLGLTRTVAPIPRWVLPMIAVARARLRRQMWRREHYRSPLEPITVEQAEGLCAALAAARPDVSWRVHVAYEFRDPLLTTLLDRLPADEAIDVLPMYVMDSAFTHELARGVVGRRASHTRPRTAPLRVLGPLAEEAFAAVSARHVARAIDARGVGGPDWALVLAAHGTLLEPPRPMETGREATERIGDAIARPLRERFALVVSGWLNHSYGGRWTEPPVEEALRRVSDAGFRQVVYFPFGFYADNAESQLEGRIALAGRPELRAVHLPCLNAEPEFLAALARHVAGSAPAEAATRTAANLAAMDAIASGGRR